MHSDLVIFSGEGPWNVQKCNFLNFFFKFVIIWPRYSWLQVRLPSVSRFMGKKWPILKIQNHLTMENNEKDFIFCLFSMILKNSQDTFYRWIETSFGPPNQTLLANSILLQTLTISTLVIVIKGPSVQGVTARMGDGTHPPPAPTVGQFPN